MSKTVEQDAKPVVVTGESSRPSPSGVPATRAKEEVLVMRAGEKIWDFEESEGQVVAGSRRPVLIMDEEVTHLANTDKKLSMQELFQRVRAYLDDSQAPVDVRLVQARWLNDGKEVRQRLVASMRDHPFKDIKLLMGLDYMGRWATFQVSVGMEPDVLPEPEGWQMPQDAMLAIAVGGGLILFWVVAHATWAFVVGALALGYAFYRWQASKKAYLAKLAAEKAMAEFKRARERLLRNFKIEDMRLFCTAMKSVYQGVIDDIVERGARVVRVEGGQGGFFSGSGQGKPMPTARMSNAAESGV